MDALVVPGVSAVGQAGAGGYVILPTAAVLAREGELNLWLVIVVAGVAALTGEYIGYLT